MSGEEIYRRSGLVMRLLFSTRQESFQKAGAEVDGRGARLAYRTGMLRAVIASLPQVFICLEALGECSPWYLPELLETPGDIVRESPGTGISLTKRHHVKEYIQR